jgi:hypothetical protein
LPPAPAAVPPGAGVGGRGRERAGGGRRPGTEIEHVFQGLAGEDPRQDCSHLGRGQAPFDEKRERCLLPEAKGQRCGEVLPPRAIAAGYRQFVVVDEIEEIGVDALVLFQATEKGQPAPLVELGHRSGEGGGAGRTGDRQLKVGGIALLKEDKTGPGGKGQEAGNLCRAPLQHRHQAAALRQGQGSEHPHHPAADHHRPLSLPSPEPGQPVEETGHRLGKVARTGSSPAGTGRSERRGTTTSPAKPPSRWKPTIRMA